MTVKGKFTQTQGALTPVWSYLQITAVQHLPPAPCLALSSPIKLGSVVYLQSGAYLLLHNSPIVHFHVKLQFQYLHRYCNPFSGHFYLGNMKAKAYFVECKDTHRDCILGKSTWTWPSSSAEKIVIFRLKTTFDEVKSRGGEHHKYLQNVNCISLVRTPWTILPPRLRIGRKLKMDLVLFY